MMSATTAADELEIRNLIGRYVDAIHRRNADDWGATWADDAVWSLPNGEDPANPIEVSGKSAIVETWKSTMSGFPFVMHMAHSGVIDVEGVSGTGRWYVSETLQASDGSAFGVFGLYKDLYTKETGAWLLRRRDFYILYSGPAELPGQVMPHPDI